MKFSLELDLSPAQRGLLLVPGQLLHLLIMNSYNRAREQSDVQRERNESIKNLPDMYKNREISELDFLDDVALKLCKKVY